MQYTFPQYLRYLLSAKSEYAVHSPFVFEFATKVLPSSPCPVHKVADEYKQHLLKEGKMVEIEDFGAGYGGAQKTQHVRPIKQVIRSSARGHKEGALLYRIVHSHQPAQMLELGTNLGFSTLYQAIAFPQAEMISIEGAKSLAQIAQSALSRWAPQVKVMNGRFEDVLWNEIDWDNFHPDHVLFDGNHRKEPTIAYFEHLLPRVADGAVLVFDDIYWSAGMTEAWREIIQHPQVTVSIDLFSMGICWVRRNQAKEHFVLRF